MAETVAIGGNGALYLGEDKTLRLLVMQKSAAGVISTTTAEDIAGFAIKFLVRKGLAGETLIEKDATVVGAYSATLLSNTQRAEVVLTDLETEVLRAKTENHYKHSWKRTDTDVETILAEGDFILEKASQVE